MVIRKALLIKCLRQLLTTVIATKKNHKYWRRRDQNEYTFTIGWGF